MLSFHSQYLGVSISYPSLTGENGRLFRKCLHAMSLIFQALLLWLLVLHIIKILFSPNSFPNSFPFRDLKFLSVFWVNKWLTILFWFSFDIALLIALKAATKFVSLSNWILLTWPLHAKSLCNARINATVYSCLASLI